MIKRKSRATVETLVGITNAQKKRLDSIKQDMRAASNGRFKARITDALDQVFRQADRPHSIANLDKAFVAGSVALLASDGVDVQEAIRFRETLERAVMIARGLE